MIGTLKELAALACDNVTILIRRDPKVRMAIVSVAGQPFMGGNDWDFKPECHGGFHYELAGIHGAWRSAAGLAQVIATFLVAKGATNVKIVDEAFDYMAEQR